MYFNSGGDSLTGNSSATIAAPSNAFFAGFWGEARPGNMLVLLSVLVLLLHVWGIIRLLSPAEQATPARPLMMEVSMITVAAPKPSMAPPPPAPPAPEKKPIPKPLPKPVPKPVPKPKPVAKPIPKPAPKPIPKPAPRKIEPVARKAPAPAPAEQAAEPEPIAQQPQPSPVQTPPAADSKPAPVAANAEQFTEANFRAHYAHNPKPEYPAVAKNRNWQGKVMLRVVVSAEGLSDSVEVEQSSGHEILDESAIEAVKKWRFIPAKRGDKAVASSVIVPIVFSLRD